MSQWCDEKIIGTSLESQAKNDRGYEIHFRTDKEDRYLKVEAVCRRQLDFVKPSTNYEKVMEMNPEEIEKWFWWMLNYVRGYTDSRLALHDWLFKQDFD